MIAFETAPTVGILTGRRSKGSNKSNGRSKESGVSRQRELPKGADGDLVISTEDLGKTYGSITALDGLNLKVPKNSIFGFLGPNGAGKTTTIKLLLGLSKPSSGRGSIFGHELTENGISIRKRIGYLAQEVAFYDYMSARETLRFKARFYYRGTEPAIEKRVADTLELVGLTNKADRPIKGLSGGERQRLGIAQAQINHPDLLILDEPAASLDPMGRRDVLTVMERLRQHSTVFYSTHILDDVQRVSDTVAILNQGRLVTQAPIEQLLSSSRNVVYLLTFCGDGEAALAKVTRQPWVSHIDQRTSGEETRWRVTVTDENAAKARLLPLMMAEPQLTVTSFGLKQTNLEETFMNLIEGGKNGNDN
jgi:ABC-2 type transport system ATP-binding protein